MPYNFAHDVPDFWTVLRHGLARLADWLFGKRKTNKRKDKMRKLIVAVIGLTCLAAWAAEPIIATADRTITSGAWEPVILETNDGPPVLEGPFIDLMRSVSTWTNLTMAAYGIYDTGTKRGGVGALALYNATPFVAGGIGVQYLNDELWMPSGQVQFQAPFTIAGKVKVTPLAFTGIGTPIAGGSDRDFADNHTVVGIFGAGMAVRTTEHLDVFFAVAKWTSFEGQQWYGGLAWRF